jgi:transposase-like protein
MVVADAHRGIQAAARRHLLGSCYQRCKVHLMRNILGRVSHRDKKAFSEKLKQIWVQPDRKSAVRTARIFMAEYRQRYPEAIAVLAEGLEKEIRRRSTKNLLFSHLISARIGFGSGLFLPKIASVDF